MRTTTKLIALTAAVAAAPALAQVNVGVGGQLGAGVRVDTGRTLDTVRGTLDRTVDRLDRTANRALDSELRVATRADVRSGVVVRDRDGRRVGTVQSVHGDTAVVVRGDRAIDVPLASLYRRGSRLVTSLSRAQLRASANAHAEADVRR